MKSKIGIIILLLATVLLTSCAAPAGPQDSHAEKESEEETMETTMLKIEIGDSVLMAEFADTQAAEALREKLEEGSAAITVSNYGGWEKVGNLPWSLPASDTQIRAVPGDIMLYQGNSIVLFYGNNSWAYTQLGTIVDLDADSLAQILGGSDSELTLSLVKE